MDILRRIEQLPSFSPFKNVVGGAIGTFPVISCNRSSLSGHQVRIFERRAEIIYSERAAVTHLEISEAIFFATQRKSNDALTSIMLALRGAEFLRSDRFLGLAFIARGFQTSRQWRTSKAQFISDMIDSSRHDNHLMTTRLYLPLAHEIGHLPQAQSLCPEVIHSEIYSIFEHNYPWARLCVGDFDFKSSFSDPTSPLYVQTLGEEFAADHFGVAAVSGLLLRMSADKEFPLIPLALGTLMFPVEMFVYQVCIKGEGTSARKIQEFALAMCCRFSITVDSLRACVKSEFSRTRNAVEIGKAVDKAIDGIAAQIREIFHFVCVSAKSLINQSNSLASITMAEGSKTTDHAKVAAILSDAIRADLSRIAIGRYLIEVGSDIDGYGVSQYNATQVKQLGELLLGGDRKGASGLEEANARDANPPVAGLDALVATIIENTDSLGETQLAELLKQLGGALAEHAKRKS